MNLFSDRGSIPLASTTRNTARALPQSSGNLLRRGSFCFIGQIDQRCNSIFVHDDLIHKQLHNLLRTLCLHFQQAFAICSHASGVVYCAIASSTVCFFSGTLERSRVSLVGEDPGNRINAELLAPPNIKKI